MGSTKVAGSKLAKDRQAALLALADSIGDAKAAAKFGVRSPTTVRSYRRALATDGELCALYEQAKARQEATDDRVVEAEASAISAVWSAVQRSAEMLGRNDEPASPEYLEALAKLIEAAGKNADARAELHMTQRVLEGQNGRRTEEAPASPAPGGRPAETRSSAGVGASISH